VFLLGGKLSAVFEKTNSSITSGRLARTGPRLLPAGGGRFAWHPRTRARSGRDERDPDDSNGLLPLPIALARTGPGGACRVPRGGPTVTRDRKPRLRGS
jgi:hypothetical protein